MYNLDNNSIDNHSSEFSSTRFKKINMRNKIKNSSKVNSKNLN